MKTTDNLKFTSKTRIAIFATRCVDCHKKLENGRSLRCAGCEKKKVEVKK